MTSPSGEMSTLLECIETIGFSGVVLLERDGDTVFELAAGLADRRQGISVELGTRFGTASATKGFTALTIVSLVESGELTLDTTIRSVVGDALSQVDPAVTVRHLLEHTSGVGDYLDEESLDDIDDHVLVVCPHTLGRPSNYLGMLNAQPQVSAPGERFAYNNSGYVMLSIVIEELTGSFHQAVADRVLELAGMTRAGFFRSDQLPEMTATGYLQDGRTNVFHLPVIGAGDGGIYLSLDDVTAFWDAFDHGDLVSAEHRDEMTEIRQSLNADRAYGLGFWLSPDGHIVWLQGMDPGISFRSTFNLTSRARYTVMSNTSSGAWPLVRALEPFIAT